MTTAKKQAKVRDLTKGPILPQILMFALPLIATSVMQLMFNTADIVVVGRFGGETPKECSDALAAVGSCSSLIALIVNFFMGLAVGTGICVAQDMGARRFGEVTKIVHTAVIAALVCGSFVGIFGFIMTPTFLRWMGTNAAVIDQSVLYMRAYFCGAPAAMLYNYCAAMLRSTGDTVRPLTFLSVAGVVNVGMNLIMVLIFHLGAMGVGIATAASQWVSCGMILFYMLRNDGPCHLDPKKLRVDRRKLSKIIRLGLPAGIQNSLFSVSNVLIQSSMNTLGEIVVAANTAAGNLEGYVYTTQNALYQTAMTFVGQNMGARNYDRMKKCIFWCVGVVTVIGIFFGSGVYLLGAPLLSIYAPGNEVVIAAGLKKLGITCVFYFLCGIMEVACGVMRGIGKSICPMIVALVGTCALRVIWVYTAFAAFPYAETLYLSYPVTWAITATAHFIFCYFNMKKLKKQLCDPKNPPQPRVA